MPIATILSHELSEDASDFELLDRRWRSDVISCIRCADRDNAHAVRQIAAFAAACKG